MLLAADSSLSDLPPVFAVGAFLLLSQSSQLKDENDDLELLPVDLVFLVEEGVYELYLEKPYC